MKKHGLILWVITVAAAAAAGVFAGRSLDKPAGKEVKKTALIVPLKMGTDVADTLSAKAADGMPFDLSQIPPYSGTFADLVKVAKDAGTTRVANVRITLLLANTDRNRLRKLAADIPRNSVYQWERYCVEAALMGRWAEVDVSGAMAFCNQMPANRARGMRYQLISVLATMDEKEALRQARRIRSMSERAGVIAMVASVVAKTDPLAALELLKTEGKNGESWRNHSIYSTWAESDPAAAFASAAALTNRSDRQSALYGVFSKWSSEDPLAAKEAAMSMPKGGERTQALGNVFGNWARNEPQAALEAAKSLEGSERHLISSVLSNWASSDPAGAANAFSILSFGDQKKSVGQLASNWTDLDPESASKWAQSLPSGMLQNQAMNQVLSKWAQIDGEAAVASLDKVPAHQRMQAMRNVLSSWVGNDQEAALSWARALENPAERSRALVSCAGALDLSKAGEVENILAEIPNGYYRTQALRGVVNANQWQDPQALVGWLSGLSEKDREAALTNASLYNLIEAEPQATADLLASSQAAMHNTWMWSQVATQLVMDDPSAALEWVGNIQAPALKKNAEISAITAWAQEDRGAAFDHARTLDDPKQKIAAVNAIISGWAQEDAEGLMRWAEEFAQGPERELALLRGSLTLAANDPAASAEVVSRLLGSDGEISAQLEGAVRQVASSWCSEDVSAACGWAAGLPEGKFQEKAIESIASSWAQFDPLATSEWISAMPGGKARNGAVSSLVQAIQQTDLDSAFLWAASVDDDGIRGNLMTSAVQNWTKIDPDSAQAKVENADVADELRASLLKIIEDSR